MCRLSMNIYNHQNNKEWNKFLLSFNSDNIFDHEWPCIHIGVGFLSFPGLLAREPHLCLGMLLCVMPREGDQFFCIAVCFRFCLLIVLQATVLNYSTVNAIVCKKWWIDRLCDCLCGMDEEPLPKTHSFFREKRRWFLLGGWIG
jgi:hypothetical protein